MDPVVIVADADVRNARARDAVGRSRPAAREGSGRPAATAAAAAPPRSRLRREIGGDEIGSLMVAITPLRRGRLMSLAHARLRQRWLQLSARVLRSNAAGARVRRGRQARGRAVLWVGLLADAIAYLTGTPRSCARGAFGCCAVMLRSVRVVGSHRQFLVGRRPGCGRRFRRAAGCRDTSAGSRCGRSSRPPRWEARSCTATSRRSSPFRRPGRLRARAARERFRSGRSASVRTSRALVDRVRAGVVLGRGGPVVGSSRPACPTGPLISRIA